MVMWLSHVVWFIALMCSPLLWFTLIGLFVSALLFLWTWKNLSFEKIWLHELEFRVQRVFSLALPGQEVAPSSYSHVLSNDVSYLTSWLCPPPYFNNGYWNHTACVLPLWTAWCTVTDASAIEPWNTVKLNLRQKFKAVEDRSHCHGNNRLASFL